MKATELELEIRREGLLKKTVRLSDVISACTVAAGAARRHKQLALQACNGIPKTYDRARGEWKMGLSEEDSARIDSDMEKARDDVHKALKAILTPGLEYDFRNDPVYCTVRVRDKANRRAFSL